MANEKPAAGAGFFNRPRLKAEPGVFSSPAGNLPRLPGEAGKAQDDIWVQICLLDQLISRPRPFYISGHSFYLSVKDGTVSAHRAVCPKDETLLFWSDARGHFHCPFCKETFNAEGNSEGGGKKLQSVPALVAEKTVFVKVP